jgi:hypothetical protein
LQAQPKIVKKLSEQQICMFSPLKKMFSPPKIRMRTTLQNLQARPKILEKILKHQINQLERTFFQKKYVSYLKSVKESKIRKRLAARRNLQVQPKIKKKKNCRNIKSTNQIKKFPNKSMFST